MTHERMQAGEWDGVTVAGSTAASILGIGDFYLSPYRILAPRRINSRNAEARFGIRGVPRDDVSFIEGIPVTGAERTLVDLVLDGEEPSLVQDAFADARAKGLDTEKLERLAAEAKASARERKTMDRLFGGVQDPGSSGNGYKGRGQGFSPRNRQSRFRLLLPQALMSRVQQA